MQINRSLTNTNALSNVTISGKKAFGPWAMGLCLEGHSHQPLRLLTPRVWACHHLHVPVPPGPQSSSPRCNPQVTLLKTFVLVVTFSSPPVLLGEGEGDTLQPHECVWAG